MKRTNLIACVLGAVLAALIAGSACYLVIQYQRRHADASPEGPDAAVDVIVVIDPKDAGEKPDQAAVYTDQKTREYLDQAGDELRIVTPDVTGEKGVPGYLTPYLAAAKGPGVKLPFVVVGRKGKVLGSFALPGSGQALIAQIEKTAKRPADGYEFVWAGGGVRYLGCLPAKPGAANRWQTEGSQPSEPLVPRAQWKDVCFEHFAGATMDQDGYSSCCACATVGDLETARARAGLKTVQLSVVDVYARGNDGRDAGMTIEDAVQIACQGVCSTQTANLWGVTTTGHKGDWQTDRLRNRALHATWCPGLDEIGSALQRRRPVVFGAMVTDEFEPDAGGVIGPKKGHERGGHALYLVGARAAKPGESPGWYFRLVNSWGESWGQKGRAWIHESWIDPRFGAFAIVAVASPSNDPLPSLACAGPSAAETPMPPADPAEPPLTAVSSPFFALTPWIVRAVFFYLAIGIAIQFYREERAGGASVVETIGTLLLYAAAAPVYAVRDLIASFRGKAAAAVIAGVVACGSLAGAAPCPNGPCPYAPRPALEPTVAPPRPAAETPRPAATVRAQVQAIVAAPEVKTISKKPHSIRRSHRHAR